MDHIDDTREFCEKLRADIAEFDRNIQSEFPFPRKVVEDGPSHICKYKGGVYIFVFENKEIYIGETQDFSMRWKSGYNDYKIYTRDMYNKFVVEINIDAAIVRKFYEAKLLEYMLNRNYICRNDNGAIYAKFNSSTHMSTSSVNHNGLTAYKEFVDNYLNEPITIKFNRDVIYGDELTLKDSGFDATSLRIIKPLDNSHIYPHQPTKELAKLKEAVQEFDRQIEFPFYRIITTESTNHKSRKHAVGVKNSAQSDGGVYCLLSTNNVVYAGQAASFAARWNANYSGYTHCSFIDELKSGSFQGKVVVDIQKLKFIDEKIHKKWREYYEHNLKIFLVNNNYKIDTHKNLTGLKCAHVDDEMRKSAKMHKDSNRLIKIKLQPGQLFEDIQNLFPGEVELY